MSMSFHKVLIIIVLIKRSSCHGNYTITDNYKFSLVSWQLQVTLLVLILSVGVVLNGSVIYNISKDSLKLKMVHFILIRHVCITDLLGAVVVLPVPLVSFARGFWAMPEWGCRIISTTTATVWTMHLVAVAMYRADRVLAVWVSCGSYPLVSTATLHFSITLLWLLVISGATLATVAFGPTFQPALALCIPNVPLIFFILVFTGYCTGLVVMATGYIYAFIWKRRKKKKKMTSRSSGGNINCGQENEMTNDEICIDGQPADHTHLPSHHHHKRSNERRYILSFCVSVGHVLLYLPAMLIIGVKGGGKLPPSVALFCGLVVYSEFLVQPIALLVASRPLLREILFFKRS